MRTILSGMMACALCGVVTISAFAQRLPPQPPGGVVIDPNAAVGLSGNLVPTVPPILDWELAGLAPGSRLEHLTWERAYALALVRSRDGRGGFAESLDPKALDEPAGQLGVADFDRFRKEFLAARPGAVGSFRDPSGDYLDLLRRFQMIENARRNVAIHENLLKLINDLIQGESGGLSQLDVDMLSAALIRMRQGLSEETGRFRDELDRVKVALGLSPHAPVIPDRRSLLAFGTAFEAVESWSRNPDRNLSNLHDLTQKLPALGDVVVDSHSIFGTGEGTPYPGTPYPGEDVLANAVRLAIKNRVGPDKGQAAGDADVQLDLRVRRRIRHLFERRHAYQAEKRSYELAVRLKDQSFERMISPSPGGVAGRFPKLDGVLEYAAQVRRAEDRLVTLWTSFRAERLALYRELGVLPYTDWASFYRDLSAE